MDESLAVLPSRQSLEDSPLLESGLSAKCKELSPKTVTKIIRRLKALVIALLPIEASDDDLQNPTSSIITKQVVEAFREAAGEFYETVPYCLLEARRSFYKDAQRDPSDYDENMGRRMACEVIARRLMQTYSAEMQPVIMCSRFTRVESDGDISLPTSALESAVDQHCPFFLSSDVAQKCVFALWYGRLVQAEDEKGHVIYNIYEQERTTSWIDLLDPTRLGVPNYQNWLKIALWIVFLIGYAIAVQTPEREWGPEDTVLYVQIAGYLLEDITKVWKVGIVAGVSFWTIVNFCIYTLVAIAFGYRMADLRIDDSEKALEFRRLSFQYLSCAAPLIWMKLLTVFDLFTYFGTLQVVVKRMLKESALFFTLLFLLAVGFTQGLTGLDASDSTPGDSTRSVAKSLFEALLGSPGFDLYSETEGDIAYPFGLVLYYLWSFATLVILLNVLVALFGTAYSDITDDAVSQYMAFFSQKVVQAIRAPDQFVYVAPFNLIELVILPLEFVLNRESYAKLNRIILRILFFPVLTVIAVFERRWRRKRHMKRATLDEEEEDYEEDPDAEDEDKKNGTICTVSFEDLKKKFPDMTTSSTTVILKEIAGLKKQLEDLQNRLDGKDIKKEDA